jgi:hypothetical protein
VPQAIAQVPPTHWAVPCASPGHLTQLCPHAPTSSSRAQAPPQAWVPGEHTKPQLWPSHVAWLAPAGTGQGAHDVPQLLTSWVEGQSAPQACLPAGQVPTQLASPAMHVPLHSFFPPVQAPPQETLPSHVAIPSPAGARQGVHDTPHVRTSSFETHVPPQVCCPSGHAGAGVASPSGAASAVGAMSPTPSPPSASLPPPSPPSRGAGPKPLQETSAPAASSNARTDLPLRLRIGPALQECKATTQAQLAANRKRRVTRAVFAQSHTRCLGAPAEKLLTVPKPRVLGTGAAGTEAKPEEPRKVYHGEL